MAIKGFSAPEVSQVCARARELCRQVGDTPQLFLVLGELGGVHLIRGELQTAREIAEQLLRLAHSLQRPARLQAAHHFLGQVWYALGEFTLARADLEQAITLYEPQRRPVPALYDSGVASLSIAAFTLWALGYPVQARTRIEEALTLAQDHPFSLSYALFCVALLHQFRREGLATYEQAEAITALAREQGFTLREAEGTVLRGWALAERGQGEEGIAQLRQGLATTRAMGAELYTPYFLGLLAEAYATIGQSEEGLIVLAEAFAVEDKTGERHYEAEISRLKGELTLQQESQNAKVKMQKSKVPKPKSQILEPESEAEACFLKAIEIAQRQQAKSFELRATVSLAQLWQQQGKHHEAHQMLSEIYAWFTGGFDTKDLQEAKALLGALSQEGGLERAQFDQALSTARKLEVDESEKHALVVKSANQDQSAEIEARKAQSSHLRLAVVNRGERPPQKARLQGRKPRDRDKRRQ